MKVSQRTSWHANIKKYIFMMLSLIFLFLVLVSGLIYWRYEVNTTKLVLANSYHLNNAAYYTEAKSEIKNILEHIKNQAFLQSININDTALPADMSKEINLSYTIAMQAISNALRIEENYHNESFTRLIKKLIKIKNEYETTNIKLVSVLNLPRLKVLTTQLLQTLDQLANLHTHYHDDTMMALEQFDHRFNQAAFVLFGMIIFSIILTTRRGLIAIGEITENQSLIEEKIERQALYDPLTQLPNRLLSLEHLTERMKACDRTGNHVALFFVDLDNFKIINDTLGHAVGDKLLQEVAQRLKHSVREVDTVGRFGGDEFIVVLGEITQPESITDIAEELIFNIKKSFLIEGKELTVTASIGIARYPEDGRQASELLQKADSAMYYSKNSGRSTHAFYNDDMHQQATRRMTIEQAIRFAVKNREFDVLYQPQYDIEKKQLIGAEALLRWTHPTLGCISPNEFIPIAEQTGEIIELGKFVLHNALETVQDWQSQFDADFRVSVNLSPRQFRENTLVDFINHSLNHFGVLHQSLELEITESVVLDGNLKVDSALNELSNLKINIAMDDFGTGYSSLGYLRRYPFNVLKIDQSFIRDIEKDQQCSGLIQAVIKMAHCLNLRVIAEGVETQAQLKQLELFSCNEVQGNFFSPPVTRQKISEILSHQNKNLIPAI